jgi:cell division septation protein DedD
MGYPYMKYFSKSRLETSSASRYISILIFLAGIFGIINGDKCAYPEEGSVYSIHLYSFKSSEEARAKANEFNELGYNAFYRKETADGKGDIYNVFIERFRTRAEAEKEANVLKELGLITDYDIREVMEKQKSIPKTVKQETKTAGKTARSYYLKVGSLKEKSNAEETVKKLREAGYNAFYNYETVKNLGDWYRVYIDEYKSKADAEKDARTLMERGIISGYEIKRTTEKIRAAETTQRNSKTVYCLHVASYRSSSNADDDVARLTGLGLKAFSKKTDISGEQWFRVYVGEFPGEAEAKKTGAELVEKGFINYFKAMPIDNTGQ